MRDSCLASTSPLVGLQALRFTTSALDLMWHENGLSVEIVTDGEALKELCPLLVSESSTGGPGHNECWIASSQGQEFAVCVTPVDKARANLFNKLALTPTQLQLCLSVEVYLDGLLATSRLLSPNDLETHGAELFISGHISLDGLSERPFCFAEREFVSHRSVRMVSSEELGTIRVVLQWRRWVEVERSSPLSECGLTGFGSSLGRAHRSIRDERYMDAAVLGDSQLIVNGNAQESHIHEPLFGAPSITLKFHYAPQSWLVSSGKDNESPMAMRRTTFASSSKHTLDHESPTANIQIKKRRRSYPASSIRLRIPPANPNPTPVLEYPPGPQPPPFARPPTNITPTPQPETPNGAGANPTVDSDIIDIDDLESDDDAPEVINPLPNPNPDLTLPNLTASANLLFLRIRARPVLLPPNSNLPPQPERQPARPIRKCVQMYDRSLILLLMRLVNDFRSLLGPSHLDEYAGELDEEIQSWRMTRVNKNAVGEDAARHRDLLLLELEQLVQQYLNLGENRRGGGKGKRRAA
ncbi:hypothetical protein BDV93DRAFT_542497 [Ceratobasidium sp. AG-I]|nr:hypothetical protein BDV93DRAFT_542497 [Ceratobasidium sp. AG-I]